MAAGPEGLEWDYVIVDGHIPGHKQSTAPHQLRVTSGSFDNNWRFSSALNFAGDAEVRAKSRQIRRPDPNLKIDPKVLESYVGKYQIVDGPVVPVYIENGKLVAVAGSPTVMIPESETVFYAPTVNVRVFFTRDAAGKVTGFTGSGDGDFEATKLE